MAQGTTLTIELDPGEPPHVGGALRGVVRLVTSVPLEDCTLATRARLRGVRGTTGAGGYDDIPFVESPLSCEPGKRAVPFELPRLRGPVTSVVHTFELRWAVVSELRDRRDEVLAQASLPIEVGRKGPGQEEEGDVVIGGYRDAPRRILPAFEPALGPLHVEGARRDKPAGFLTTLERALFGGTGDVDATLEVEPPRMEGGGPLAVTLYTYARSSTRIHQATVSLVRREGWGDVLVADHEQVIAEETVAKGLDIAAGHHRLKGRLVVPDDPAGSYADDCFYIEWVVRASVTSESGTDLVREFVVSVL